MKKSYPATLSNLKKIRATIKDFLKIYEVDLKIIKNIQLAVDEAVTNIIKHAYKGENKNNIIKIELELKNKKFQIHLYDNGIKVNKKNIKPRSLDNIKPGGLGIYFIDQLMDETKYLKSNKWINHLVLKKNII
ncbi:ATP-binding protein [Candidatus Pelagibacter sp. HIMB1715]|uniref:ATP-binding protein n=1 Tax=Candidatus Pelagibacter sp. HIMB1715 TaxID=3413369 RepID=UPI003F835A7E